MKHYLISLQIERRTQQSKKGNLYCTESCKNQLRLNRLLGFADIMRRLQSDYLVYSEHQRKFKLDNWKGEDDAQKHNQTCNLCHQLRELEYSECVLGFLYRNCESAGEWGSTYY